MAVDGPPTAEGDLAGTPFAHLVVYALERKLSGTLLLQESDDRVHTLTFLRGNPAKCRPGDDFARLGRLLVDEGVIDETVLEAALSTHGLMSQAGLLGDVLVMAGHVEPEELDRVAERQFRLRFVRLFALPAATRYRWYEGADALADWGAEPTRADAFELLWAGLERYGDKASSMEPSLAALGEDQPLAIHPRAPLERLGLEGLASEIVELLLLEPVSLPELCSLDVAPAELCRRVTFAMLLLRFVDLGRGGLPIGVVEKSSTTLARVRLKQAARQRLVAAAEDESGDGERVPSRRRGVDPRRDSTPGGEPVALASEAPAAPSSASEAPAPSASEAPAPTASEAPAPTASEAPAPPASEAPAPPASEAPAPPASEAPAPPASEAPAPASSAAGARPRAPRVLVEPAQPPIAPLTLEPEDAEPDSSVRAIQRVIEGKPLADLVSLARARLEARDATTALQLAEAALEREPGHLEARVLAVAARALRPHADAKALVLQLDEIVAASDACIDARYQRGVLRKRLGDDAGARRDFERVMELDPAHDAARARLAGLEPGKPQGAAKGGLLGRLFRR